MATTRPPGKGKAGSKKAAAPRASKKSVASKRSTATAAKKTTNVKKATPGSKPGSGKRAAVKEGTSISSETRVYVKPFQGLGYSSRQSRSQGKHIAVPATLTEITQSLGVTDAEIARVRRILLKRGYI